MEETRERDKRQGKGTRDKGKGARDKRQGKGGKGQGKEAIGNRQKNFASLLEIWTSFAKK